MLSSKLLASDLITNQYYQHLLKRLEDIMSSAALQLYRLLHRSARMYIPTKVGRQFAQERIRSEFRAHQFEQDPIIINALLHRAYSALMSSLDETAKKRLEKGILGCKFALKTYAKMESRSHHALICTVKEVVKYSQKANFPL